MKLSLFLKVFLGVVGLALVVFLGVQTRNALEQYNYIGKAVRDRDTIVISGTGKVNATPDLAQIQLGVQTDALTVKAAQAQNTEKMNAIIAAAKKMGVADKDVQTTGYSIYPKTEWRDGRSNIVGYTVSQQVTVKLREMDRVGDLLEQAGTLGANQVGGIDFTVDDPTALREEARAKAIADARKKAEQLADQIGLKIVKVVTFSEGSNYNPRPVPVMYEAKAMDAIGGAAPSIEAGSLDISSDVSVTFEVR